MEQFGGLVARVLYLVSPLLVAAALAGIVQHDDFWTLLKRPIDGGASIRGRRGVACALADGIATVAVQRYFVGDRAGTLAVIGSARAHPFALGAAMGRGAMLGELPNSFVKRRLDIAPGSGATGILRPVFYRWDQVDFLTTTWPIRLVWVRPGWELVPASFIMAPAIHQLLTPVGFLVGARRRAVRRLPGE
jgi:hypothetical protein